MDDLGSVVIKVGPVDLRVYVDQSAAVTLARRLASVSHGPAARKLNAAAELQLLKARVAHLEQKVAALGC